MNGYSENSDPIKVKHQTPFYGALATHKKATKFGKIKIDEEKCNAI